MSFRRMKTLAAAVGLSLALASSPARAESPANPLSPAARASLLSDVNGGLPAADQSRFAAFLSAAPPGTQAKLFDYLAVLPQNQRAEFASFLLRQDPAARAQTIDGTVIAIDTRQRLTAQRTAYERSLTPDYKALKQRRPPAVILGELDAQLSPQEISEFQQLLDQSPAATRDALIDFIGQLPTMDYDDKMRRFARKADAEGAFVAELLERSPRQRANILGFISRLNADQRTGAAGTVATDDVRGGDQWENFFLYVGSAAPDQSFASLFPADPMNLIFATQWGYGPDDALWIYTGQGADIDACKAAARAGDQAAAATACKWEFARPAPEVSNGDDAPEIPWQVEIYRVGDAASNKFTSADLQSEQVNYGTARTAEDRDEACGGVLIPGNWVLTAAHCIYVPNKPFDWVLYSRRARTGTNSLRSGGTTWKIAGVLVHSGYDPRLIRNDIALIKIEADPQTRLSANSKARPIALPPPDAPVPDGTSLLLTGWGMKGEMGIGALRDIHGKARIKSSNLLAANLTKIALNECQENKNFRHEKYVLGAGQLCALGQRNQDACEGDSGGPLVHQVRAWARLVGIVSFGPGCGLDNTASVYTDVAYFRGWIDEAMKNLKPGQVVKWPAPGAPLDKPPPAKPSQGASAH